MYQFYPRFALQLIGTDVLRKTLTQDIWLNSLEYRIRKQNNNASCTVISDARFRNELDHQEMGGVVIWVQRGDLPEWFETAFARENAVSRKIMETKYRDVHESEWNWAGYLRLHYKQ